MLTRYLFLALLLSFFAHGAFATDVSIPAAVANLMTPISIFTDTIYNICYVLAVMLFVASIAQYRAYRLSPSNTPLNRPIILSILAIAVALTPMIAKLSESAAYTHL